ncbi:hypothetical protein B0H16DRAFT_1877330 [Mycena metata]|uniref:Uncharacterized protein n=1 Tax=Mycena metata TaxID=1033252 RepID=A0AAD7KD02_9AGAR|nr:hypothetical protein B0H16DRAFT_1877330 [Mycena metata]
MSQFPVSNACDSPSTTMEKGRYRMRAPSVIPLDNLHPSKQPVRRPTSRKRDGSSSLLAALVVLLALACLASFGFAYYLFTTSKPLRYVNSDSLRRDLVLASKTGLRHCSQLRGHFIPPECLDLHFTHVSPAWLFNLTAVEGFPPLVYLDDLSGRSIHHHLQLPAHEILTLRDLTPYHYRFIDTTSSTAPFRNKYTESIYIPTFAQSPHRLIEIGTLFGSSRLRLRNQSNKRLRTQIRRSMEFSSPELVEIADAIGTGLGGQYLGAHIRLGDGSFRANGETNLRQVWWKLIHQILQFNISEALYFERAFQVSPSIDSFEKPALVANTSSHSPLSGFSPANLRCRGHLHPAPLDRLNSVLFISTDVKNPATDPSFTGFLHTFPCAFFLSDFPMLLRRLDRLRNEYDGVTMTSFLLPLLDALVVSRAAVIAGTEGSTFSRFTQDVLWTKHHGLDIVERG